MRLPVGHSTSPGAEQIRAPNPSPGASQTVLSAPEADPSRLKQTEALFSVHAAEFNNGTVMCWWNLHFLNIFYVNRPWRKQRCFSHTLNVSSFTHTITCTHVPCIFFLCFKYEIFSIIIVMCEKFITFLPPEVFFSFLMQFCYPELIEGKRDLS